MSQFQNRDGDEQVRQWLAQDPNEQDPFHPKEETGS
jgi:hypothetical protein